jgi:ankyrin repeat protein
LSNKELYIIIAKNGDLETLKFLLTSKWLLASIISRKHDNSYFPKKELSDNRRIDGHHICCIAAENGHLKIIKWLHKKYCIQNISQICYIAAICGDLKIVKYLWRKDCVLNEKICSDAAFFGHSHIVKWFLNKGCPLYQNVCFSAAESGNFEFFKWCYDNGYPLSRGSCITSAESGNLEIFKFHYGKKLQCYLYHPHSQCINDFSNYVERNEHLEIIDWINIHGFPIHSFS